MRRRNLKGAFAMLWSLTFITCSQPGTPPSGKSTSTHVYISGEVGSSTNGILPVYWKDGVINYLQLSPPYTNGYAFGIAVDTAGTVYVQGGQFVGNTSNIIYGYWKGSTFTALTLPYANTAMAETGIAVDTSGNVWLAYTVGSSSPPTIPAYWLNSGYPNSLPNATNVISVGADTSGNVYFLGTTGGASSNATPYNNNWTPTVWKNGTSASALPLTGANIYGVPHSLALDASGSVYVCGQQWSAIIGMPVYWKEIGGIWGNPTPMNEGAYSSSIQWWGPAVGIAVDGAGTVDCMETIAGTTPSNINRYYSSSGTPAATLICWKGISNAPTAVALLSGYTYWYTWYNGGVDAGGDYIVAGALANSSAEASNDTGIPVYWKNEGNPFQLPLGSNSGAANTYGKAFSVAVGP